jgi:hypothetical protein
MVYLVLRRVPELVALLALDDVGKDIEILVSRHEPAVLRRQSRGLGCNRPIGCCLQRCHGCFVAAMAGVLRHAATLPRWHRDLVARRWTYRAAHRDGRPSTRGRRPRAGPSPGGREPDLGHPQVLVDCLSFDFSLV